MRGILGAMSGTGSTPTRRPTLALHACCGPCLIEPYDAFVRDGHAVTVIYYNPNIHPAEEYLRRLATLRDYAVGHGVTVVELAYDPDAWTSAVAGASTRDDRCRACHQLRLSVVSDWAAAHGYDSVSTTLSVSPYQNVEVLAAAGESCSAAAGVAYLHRDFRDRYGDTTRRSREEGMYRQNYCGCSPSAEEARVERIERKAARQAQRAKPQSGL